MPNLTQLPTRIEGKPVSLNYVNFSSMLTSNNDKRHQNNR